MGPTPVRNAMSMALRRNNSLNANNSINDIMNSPMFATYLNSPTKNVKIKAKKALNLNDFAPSSKPIISSRTHQQTNEHLEPGVFCPEKFSSSLVKTEPNLDVVNQIL